MHDQREGWSPPADKRCPKTFELRTGARLGQTLLLADETRFAVVLRLLALSFDDGGPARGRLPRLGHFDRGVAVSAGARVACRPGFSGQ
jgi:hypothetical protein